MNINNNLYNEYLNIVNNWPLDDWSINCECFEKIVELIKIFFSFYYFLYIYTT